MLTESDRRHTHDLGPRDVWGRHLGAACLGSIGLLDRLENLQLLKRLGRLLRGSSLSPEGPRLGGQVDG